MNHRKIRNEIAHSFDAKRFKLNEIEVENGKLEQEIMKLKSDYNDLNCATALPSELMTLVLRELPVSSHFACEQVCTRWNEYVRNLNTEKLVYARIDEPKPRWWRRSNEVCDRDSTIVQDDFQFSFRLENSFLSNVKCLKIDNQYDDYRSDRIWHELFLKNLDVVNKLTRLEVLEIANIDFEGEKEHTITLPNLRDLAIDRVHSKLKLNTPSLSSYRTKTLTNVTFVFAEMITHLQLGAGVSAEIQELELRNLEYLAFKVSSIRQSSYLTDDFFGCHPKMRVLSMRPSLKRLSKSTYASARAFALDILERKKKSKADLKIVFFGIQLDDASQLENYEHRKDLIKLQLENYSKLCSEELKWIKQLNYVSVLEHFANEPDKIPDDFFEKFQFVSEIYVRNMEGGDENAEEKRLIEFLEKFRCIRSLNVYYSSLSKEFFERLSKVHPNVWRLNIEEDEYDFGLNSLFHLIGEFKHLYCLRTNSCQNENFVEDLSKQLGDQFCCTFSYNDCLITVEHKNDDLPYLLYEGGKLQGDFNHLGDLLTKMYESFGD